MFNNLDAEHLVDNFLSNYLKSIKNLFKINFKSDTEIVNDAMILSLKDELIKGCISFYNKNQNINGIESYLFYIVNDFFKKKSKENVSYKKEYICPGCTYFKVNTILKIKGQILYCDVCEHNAFTCKDEKKKFLYECFSKHNKSGYRCQSCERFIPQPIIFSEDIICPYLDCCFIGKTTDLNKMRHSSVKVELKKTDIEKKQISDNKLLSDESLILKDDFLNKVKTIKEVIETQNNSVAYSSSDFTIKHKNIIYQSFLNLLNKYPEDMVEYLLYSSRSGGFQHKIFQEYIKLLENTLPYSFKKNNKIFIIENILDKNLNIFDGISTYNDFIRENGVIKNNTQEFYIGGRAANITKPYYIGKLLNIINIKDKKSLLDDVKEYTFSNIKLNKFIPLTEVIVTHLRVPPHYQMGVMSHINRIRKKIIDKSKIILKI